MGSCIKGRRPRGSNSPRWACRSRHRCVLGPAEPSAGGDRKSRSSAGFLLVSVAGATSQKAAGCMCTTNPPGPLAALSGDRRHTATIALVDFAPAASGDVGAARHISVSQVGTGRYSCPACRAVLCGLVRLGSPCGPRQPAGPTSLLAQRGRSKGCVPCYAARFGTRQYELRFSRLVGSLRKEGRGRAGGPTGWTLEKASLFKPVGWPRGRGLYASPC